MLLVAVGSMFSHFTPLRRVRPSVGHHPQLRNTHIREPERDDDDFDTICTLSFGTLLLLFYIPSVLAPDSAD